MVVVFNGKLVVVAVLVGGVCVRSGSVRIGVDFLFFVLSFQSFALWRLARFFTVLPLRGERGGHRGMSGQHV